MPRFPKREEAKRRTRRALVEAGIQEIAEKGLEGASVRGICGRAGLTQGAFYVHFESREAMLATCVEAGLGRQAQTLLGMLEQQGFLQTAARSFSATQSRARSREPRGLRFHHVLEACIRFPDFRSRFVTVLQRVQEGLAKRFLEEQQKGRVRVDVNADDLAHHLLIFMMGVNGAAEAGFELRHELSAVALQRILAAPDDH